MINYCGTKKIDEKDFNDLFLDNAGKGVNLQVTVINPFMEEEISDCPAIDYTFFISEKEYADIPVWDFYNYLEERAFEAAYRLSDAFTDWSWKIM